jgi:GNAT superfamily N-acetyltransferase
MIGDQYDIVRPSTPDEWRDYHEIRRRVLWERRGRYGVYDESHPDEWKLGNHPLVLMHGDAAVGVVRIDIVGRRAILRRVAIREDVQKMGHGRALMELAEKFARDHDCIELYSFVSPEAVGFYERCGFRRDPEDPGNARHIPMGA